MNFFCLRVVQCEIIFMVGVMYENFGDECILVFVMGYFKCRYIEYINIDFF